MTMSVDPIRWPAEAIWEAVVPSLEGFTVEVLPSIDSTNTELMRRARGGPGVAPHPEPILLIAEQQTAGRGRLGRHWLGRRGDSLTFSLGLPFRPADWSGLSLAVGISLADSLDPCSGASSSGRPDRCIGLKWPNDLWLEGPKGERKLGGILVETANVEGLRYVVIGVGINLRAVAFAAADEPAVTATSASTPMPAAGLDEVLPDVDAAQALLRVLPPLVQAIQAFEQFGFAPFQARFTRRDVLSGRAVQLSDGTVGEAHGVTEYGALLVHTSAGMKEITSSEVSVRPAGASSARPPATGRPVC